MSQPAFELEVRLERMHPSGALCLELVTRSAALGVFGPSGAGKSTLLEAIAGLRPAIERHVRVGEEILCDRARGLWVPPERRDVGFVPQASLLFPHIGVRGNLLAGSGRQRAAPRPAPSLEEIVEMLELSAVLGRSPAQLSGGERQRVALGRALLSGPRLLLLDEPFAALDRPLRGRVSERLAALCREFGWPLLLVSHDAEDVRALCDEVVVLDSGQIAGQGAVEAIL